MRFLIPALILVVIMGLQLAHSSASPYGGMRMTVLRITSNALVGLTCFAIVVLTVLYALSQGAA